MDEFLFSILEQPVAYGLILVLTGTACWWGGRRTSVSIFDPWMAQAPLTMFASTSVLFMYWTGQISFSMTAYHVTAISLFFIAASLNPPKAWARQPEARMVWRVGPHQTKRLQGMVFMIMLGMQLILWSVTGLPVLLPSRLDAAATGGGLGLLTRIVAVLTTVIIFLTVMRIGQRRSGYRVRRDASIMLCVLFIQVANGSKSSIIFTVLYFLTSDWICARLNPGHKTVHFSRKAIVIAILSVTGLSLLPFVLENLLYATSTSESAFAQFAFRAILSGDTYIFFLGQGYLTQLKLGSPLLLLFSDLLGSLRLIPRDALPTHPGLLLTRELFPYSDAIKGPNMRLDLYGYTLGGWVPGLVFVGLTGLLFSRLRSLVFRSSRTSVTLVAVYLFFNAPSLFVDPTLGSTMLLNAALSLPLFRLLLFISKPKPRISRAGTKSLGNRRSLPSASA